MNIDIDKVFLTLKLEFSNLEEALLAKQRLGEYFKNIRLNVEKVNYKRKLMRQKLILERLNVHHEPVLIGYLWRLVRPGMNISYKQFSRDISELLLKGDICGKRQKGYGGNTTILWVKGYESATDKYKRKF